LVSKFDRAGRVLVREASKIGTDEKTFFLIVLLYALNGQAEEQYIGYFSGTENREQVCGSTRSINRQILPFAITFTALESDRISGSMDPRFGTITYTGTVDEDGKVKGKMKGLDTGGIRWTGFFNAIFDNGRLILDVSGQASPGNCRFRSRIQAARFQPSG